MACKKKRAAALVARGFLGLESARTHGRSGRGGTSGTAERREGEGEGEGELDLGAKIGAASSVKRGWGSVRGGRSSPSGLLGVLWSHCLSVLLAFVLCLEGASYRLDSQPISSPAAP